MNIPSFGTHLLIQLASKLRYWSSLKGRNKEAFKHQSSLLKRILSLSSSWIICPVVLLHLTPSQSQQSLFLLVDEFQVRKKSISAVEFMEALSCKRAALSCSQQQKHPFIPNWTKINTTHHQKRPNSITFFFFWFSMTVRLTKFLSNSLTYDSNWSWDEIGHRHPTFILLPNSPHHHYNKCKACFFLSLTVGRH